MDGLLTRFSALFTRHQHTLATAALIVGFAIDVITFRTLSLTIAELVLAAHLTVVAGTIVVSVLPVRGRGEKLVAQIRTLTPLLHQYSTGSLLSAFLVLYAASGSLVASAPFLILLVIAAVGNETLKLQTYRLPFQTTLFFLNLFLFAALATPIALGMLGLMTFLAAAVAAVGVFIMFMLVLRFILGRAYHIHQNAVRTGFVSVLGLLVFLYFVNVIPPIPLSVKTAGAYHSVTKVGDHYVVADEERVWYERFFDLEGVRLHLAPGSRAYVYTAVFAPARLNTTVVHRWERFNSTSGAWETHSMANFPIVGGRAGGYRGYSFVDGPAPGRWRVSVETARGQVIGRVYLTVIRAPTGPLSSTILK